MRKKMDQQVINAQRDARTANRCLSHTPPEASLGEHAVRIARVAAAMHMTQAAGLLPLVGNPQVDVATEAAQ